MTVQRWFWAPAFDEDDPVYSVLEPTIEQWFLRKGPNSAMLALGAPKLGAKHLAKLPAAPAAQLCILGHGFWTTNAIGTKHNAYSPQALVNDLLANDFPKGQLYTIKLYSCLSACIPIGGTQSFAEEFATILSQTPGYQIAGSLVYGYDGFFSFAASTCEKYSFHNMIADEMRYTRDTHQVVKPVNFVSKAKAGRVAYKIAGVNRVTCESQVQSRVVQSCSADGKNDVYVLIRTPKPAKVEQ